MRWNERFLSLNPSMTPEFIENHLDWEWDIEQLSINPSITPEFIESSMFSRRYEGLEGPQGAHSDWKLGRTFVSMS